MKDHDENVISSNNRIKMTELEALSGFSKATIYNYLKIGLIHKPFKASLGRSFYDSSHLVKLKQIRELKEVQKLSLSEIKQKLSTMDTQKILDSHEDDTGQVVSEMKEKQESIRSHKIDKKKHEILDASIALFSEKGYDNTTLEAIADSLQMAKSTVYLYFNNKEDLFLSCMERLTIVAIPETDWDNIRNEKNPLIRIHKRCYYFLKGFPTYKGVLNMARAALMSNNLKLAQKAKEILILMTQPTLRDLRWGVNNGFFRHDIDIELISHLTLSIGEGLGFCLMLDDRHDIESILKVHLELLNRWLLPNNDIGDSVAMNRVLAAGEVIDLNGVKTKITNITIDNKTLFPAKIGKAQVEIDISKLEQIKCIKQSLNLNVELITKKGQKVIGEINTCPMLYGESEFGKFSIELKDVKTLRFDDEKKD